MLKGKRKHALIMVANNETDKEWEFDGDVFDTIIIYPVSGIINCVIQTKKLLLSLLLQDVRLGDLVDYVPSYHNRMDHCWQY